LHLASASGDSSSPISLACPVLSATAAAARRTPIALSSSVAQRRILSVFSMSQKTALVWGPDPFSRLRNTRFGSRFASVQLPSDRSGSAWRIPHTHLVFDFAQSRIGNLLA
jgi:hypothetical protein